MKSIPVSDMLSLGPRTPCARVLVPTGKREEYAKVVYDGSVDELVACLPPENFVRALSSREVAALVSGDEGALRAKGWEVHSGPGSIFIGGRPCLERSALSPPMPLEDGRQVNQGVFVNLPSEGSDKADVDVVLCTNFRLAGENVSLHMASGTYHGGMLSAPTIRESISGVTLLELSGEG